mmetsp:Transcript_37102/g.86700  ORF Transcript_37102/g.86700 Transcript_37102/m.86700 type:complete len:218 (+) Transcript_37102:245-898(+)
MCTWPRAHVVYANVNLSHERQMCVPWVWPYARADGSAKRRKAGNQRRSGRGVRPSLAANPSSKVRPISLHQAERLQQCVHLLRKALACVVLRDQTRQQEEHRKPPVDLLGVQTPAQLLQSSVALLPLTLAPLGSKSVELCRLLRKLHVSEGGKRRVLHARHRLRIDARRLQLRRSALNRAGRRHAPAHAERACARAKRQQREVHERTHSNAAQRELS